MIGQNLLARRIEVPVVVEVRPGVDESRARRRDVDALRRADHERADVEHAVFVIESIDVVAGGRGVGLAVRFAVHARAEEQPRTNHMPSTVVGQQRSIRGRSIAVVQQRRRQFVGGP